MLEGRGGRAKFRCEEEGNKDVKVRDKMRRKGRPYLQRQPRGGDRWNSGEMEVLQSRKESRRAAGRTLISSNWSLREKSVRLKAGRDASGGSLAVSDRVISLLICAPLRLLQHSEPLQLHLFLHLRLCESHFLQTAYFTFHQNPRWIQERCQIHTDVWQTRRHEEIWAIKLKIFGR